MSSRRHSRWRCSSLPPTASSWRHAPARSGSCSDRAGPCVPQPPGQPCLAHDVGCWRRSKRRCSSTASTQGNRRRAASSRYVQAIAGISPPKVDHVVGRSVRQVSPSVVIVGPTSFQGDPAARAAATTNPVSFETWKRKLPMSERMTAVQWLLLSQRARYMA